MNVVFDIGGVLLDFGLHHLYADEFSDPSEMDWFLGHVLTRQHWIETDAGKPVAEMVAELSCAFPDYADLLQLVDSQYPRVIGGTFAGTVTILEALFQSGCPLYCITNYPAEKYQVVRRIYPFLKFFRDVVVSGEEYVIKPDPRIFEILLRRNDLIASDCLFIDDMSENIAAARALGMQGHHFQSSELLAVELRDRGII